MLKNNIPKEDISKYYGFGFIKRILINQSNMNKIVVYKKTENGGEHKGMTHYYLIISLHNIKENLDYEITQERYELSIEMFEMKNVPSIFDECYETVIE